MSLTIIGFGKQISRDLGAAGREQSCIWCGTLAHYRLIRIPTWFTYFFIPIIPYRTRYRLMCHACRAGMAISLVEVRAAKRGELTLRRE